MNNYKPTRKTAWRHGRRCVNALAEVLLKAILPSLTIAWMLLLSGCPSPTTPEHVHDYGEWTVTTAAFCLTEGVETRTCSLDASHTETRPIAALPHDMDWVVTTALTSSALGVETHSCQRAGCDHTGETRGYPQMPYIITGSGTSFTAKIDGTTIDDADGAAIADVITAIRSHAGGADIGIQFDDGGTLDIGTERAIFDNANANGDGTWGHITLTGSITSANTGAGHGTIELDDNVTITSTADIFNTSTETDRLSIRIEGTATLNITGGTVEVSGGSAISCGTGTVLNISGGTVKTNTRSAIQVLGTVNISGNALVTGASTTDIGTIWIFGADARVNISGGVVRNTAANDNAKAISIFGSPWGNSNHPDALIITGGTVGAMDEDGNGTIGMAIAISTPSGITISQANPSVPTLITSANTTAGRGTIIVVTADGSPIAINSGRVENTADHANAQSIVAPSDNAAGRVVIEPAAEVEPLPLWMAD